MNPPNLLDAFIKSQRLIAPAENITIPSWKAKEWNIYSRYYTCFDICSWWYCKNICYLFYYIYTRKNWHILQTCRKTTVQHRFYNPKNWFIDKLILFQSAVIIQIWSLRELFSMGKIPLIKINLCNFSTFLRYGRDISKRQYCLHQNANKILQHLKSSSKHVLSLPKLPNNLSYFQVYLGASLPSIYNYTYQLESFAFIGR